MNLTRLCRVEIRVGSAYTERPTARPQDFLPCQREQVVTAARATALRLGRQTAQVICTERPCLPLGPPREPCTRARLEALMGPGSVADCANAQNCVRICPKEIPLAESIAEVNRQTLRQAIRGWLFG